MYSPIFTITNSGFQFNILMLQIIQTNDMYYSNKQFFSLSKEFKGVQCWTNMKDGVLHDIYVFIKCIFSVFYVFEIGHITFLFLKENNAMESIVCRELWAFFTNYVWCNYFVSCAYFMIDRRCGDVVGETFLTSRDSPTLMIVTMDTKFAGSRTTLKGFKLHFEKEREGTVCFLCYTDRQAQNNTHVIRKHGAL